LIKEWIVTGEMMSLLRDPNVPADLRTGLGLAEKEKTQICNVTWKPFSSSPNSASAMGCEQAKSGTKK
jgi:hypothetical protein